MADNNNILNEAETASENDNLDNNLTNEDYNGTTDNKESQYVPNIDVFSTDKVNSYVKLSDKYEDIKSSAATMLIVGGVGLATEEERRVAAVDDGLRLLIVFAFQLAHGLQDDGDADVTGTGDRDGLLNLRDGADVGELIEDEMHRGREFPAIIRKGFSAQLVDGLPHEDGEQGVNLHLVIGQKFAHAVRRDGRKAHVAGNEDGF